MKRLGLIAVLATMAVAPSALAQFEVTTTAGYSTSPWDPAYAPPRTPTGHPSFEGTWTNASLTMIERSRGMDKLVLTEEDVQRLEGMAAMRKDVGGRATDPDAPIPTEGANVGGYNSFWIDSGTRVARVNGEPRSSWLTSTADGKLPYSANGEKSLLALRKQQQDDYDNPETRGTGERCTAGFGSTSAPPMMNVLYNNMYKFVQDAATLGILVEMNHQTRLVRIGGTHRHPSMTSWLGDSVGEWDGDTLVVTTKYQHPQHHRRSAVMHEFLLSDDAVVEERFTRVSDHELFYEFTVTDPLYYSEPWSGEKVFLRTDAVLFEYACHEGNYSLPGILAGARREESMSGQ